MEAGGGISIQRRQLISDQKLDSPNLRDYLRIRQDENMSSTTLSAVLKSEDRNGVPIRTHSNRTLLDIIRDDPNGGSNSKDSRNGWRNLKEKLRLRRLGSGSSWTSSVPVPASDVPIQPTTSSNRMMMLSRRDSTRLNMSTSDESSQSDVDLSSGAPRSRSAMLQRNDSQAIRTAVGRYENARGIDEEMEVEGEETTAAAEDDEEEEGGEGGGDEGEEQSGRMSLMALLAETDRQMGLDGSSYIMEEDDDDEEEEEGGAGGGGYNNCCVCMVRHKGAAFIPCGHTFCRLCSRELWVQR